MGIRLGLLSSGSRAAAEGSKGPSILFKEAIVSVRFEYIGEPMLTRGEYGEEVSVIHRMSGWDELEHDPEGDAAVVWDCAFGWIVLGRWESWASDAGEPIVE